MFALYLTCTTIFAHCMLFCTVALILINFWRCLLKRSMHMARKCIVTCHVMMVRVCCHHVPIIYRVCVSSVHDGAAAVQCELVTGGVNVCVNSALRMRAACTCCTHISTHFCSASPPVAYCRGNGAPRTHNNATRQGGRAQGAVGGFAMWSENVRSNTCHRWHGGAAS